MSLFQTIQHEESTDTMMDTTTQHFSPFIIQKLDFTSLLLYLQSAMWNDEQLKLNFAQLLRPEMAPKCH